MESALEAARDAGVNLSATLKRALSEELASLKRAMAGGELTRKPLARTCGAIH
jgi:post-segregation antitoxin (ccd killing protein)